MTRHMRLERRNCERGGNGVDVSLRGNSYRQNGAVDRVEKKALRAERKRVSWALPCAGYRKNGVCGSAKMGITGVMEMNIIWKISIKYGSNNYLNNSTGKW